MLAVFILFCNSSDILLFPGNDTSHSKLSIIQATGRTSYELLCDLQPEMAWNLYPVVEDRCIESLIPTSVNCSSLSKLNDCRLKKAYVKLLEV